MTSIYAKLLAALDQQFIFPNRDSSSVSKLDAYFDYRTQENVVILEYRVHTDSETEVDESDDDNDDDRTGPRMNGATKVRMSKARREIPDKWDKEFAELLKKYPYLDDYHL